MRKRLAEQEPARLHWGGPCLFLGAWNVGEINPEWGMSCVPTGAPRWWVYRVGVHCYDENTQDTAIAAMERVEWLVAISLAGNGQRQCEFRRQDGSKRLVRIPDGCA